MNREPNWKLVSPSLGFSMTRGLFRVSEGETTLSDDEKNQLSLILDGYTLKDLASEINSSFGAIQKMTVAHGVQKGKPRK